jgi:hypothetical protein
MKTYGLNHSLERPLRAEVARNKSTRESASGERFGLSTGENLAYIRDDFRAV